MMAFNDVFWVLAVFILVTLPTIFLLKHVPLQHAHAHGSGSTRAAPQHAS